MYITENTLDDLLRVVLDRLLSKRRSINPSKGENTELTGVCLELKSPRARLSRTELKGTIFSCLGEFLWYMAGSNRLDFITHYIKVYRKFSDDQSTLHGAYGARLFKWNGANQFENVTRLLRKRPASRQAVVQLFDATDLAHPTKDVPCTCVLQFLARGGKLHLITYMRSNDAFLGLPHDLFAFTMLQELAARSLNLRLGSYRHFVGSMHLYKRDRDRARAFLREGWQSSIQMPPMPPGDQWSSLRVLLKLEKSIRTKGIADIEDSGLKPYWRDLAYLLLAYRQFVDRDSNGMVLTRAKFCSRVFDSYVEDKIRKLTRAHRKGNS